MVFERTLSYTSHANSCEQRIVVKLGIPYFPAKTAGMEQFHACPFQIATQASINEALGIDRMQALGEALSIIHLYLQDLCAQGQLRWPDGRPYDHLYDCPFPSNHALRSLPSAARRSDVRPQPARRGHARIRMSIEDIMFVERTFSFKTPEDPVPAVMTARIGMPYFPAVTEGMETQYGCRVDFSSSPSIHEGVGIDEMQALGSALTIVHLSFKRLSEQGELRWLDGRLYNHRHECPLPLENQLNIAESKKAIHPGGGTHHPSPDAA